MQSVQKTKLRWKCLIIKWINLSTTTKGIGFGEYHNLQAKKSRSVSEKVRRKHEEGDILYPARSLAT
jgi:hypothetical protein